MKIEIYIQLLYTDIARSLNLVLIGFLITLASCTGAKTIAGKTDSQLESKQKVYVLKQDLASEESQSAFQNRTMSIPPVIIQEEVSKKSKRAGITNLLNGLSQFGVYTQ